jgi:hypothetical protein
LIARPKLHAWLVGALMDAGYQQRDLAKAWKVDDAVVSRFISIGKPDLTPQRQMVLAQMLNITNDALLAKLYGEDRLPAPRGVTALPHVVVSREDEQLPGPVQIEMRRAVERLERLLPGAIVTINITYSSGGGGRR